MMEVMTKLLNMIGNQILAFNAKPLITVLIPSLPKSSKTGEKRKKPWLKRASLNSRAFRKPIFEFYV